MQAEERICYCYDVSLRKLRSFARRVRLQRPSQMSECLGAGTGCGWCVPFLIRIAQDPDNFALADMTADQYADLRRNYIRSGQPRNAFG